MLFTSAVAALLALSPACRTVAQGSGGNVPRAEPIIELRLAQEAPAPGFVRMEFLGRKGGVYVAERGIVSDDGIEQIHVQRGAGGLLLDVHFSPEGAARLVEATKGGVGQHLAVLAKSRLAGASPIVAPLTVAGRRVTIGLTLPSSAAEEIAASIAARWPQ
jgi:hypothetical protein